MARFDNGIAGTIKNSFTLCMINFPKFILIWLINIIAVAVSIGFPPAALVIPAGATYLCQMITEKAFTAAMSVESSRENTEDQKAEISEDPEDICIEAEKND
jgi:hypothetical protein